MKNLKHIIWGICTDLCWGYLEESVALNVLDRAQTFPFATFQAITLIQNYIKSANIRFSTNLNGHDSSVLLLLAQRPTEECLHRFCGSLSNNAIPIAYFLVYPHAPNYSLEVKETAEAFKRAAKARFYND